MWTSVARSARACWEHTRWNSITASERSKSRASYKPSSKPINQICSVKAFVSDGTVSANASVLQYDELNHERTVLKCL